MVTIAWHMLTNKEPYRYASPRCTDEKLAGLRVRATGEKRKTGPAKGSKPASKLGTGKTRTTPSLDEVYDRQGLPNRRPPPRVNGGWSIRAERSNTLPRWKSGKSCPGSKGSAAECEGRERRAGSAPARQRVLPPAFAIASPGQGEGEAMAKAGGRGRVRTRLRLEFKNTIPRLARSLPLSQGTGPVRAASPGPQAEPFAWATRKGLLPKKSPTWGCPEQR